MNFDQKSLFIIFFIFSEKAGVVDYFAVAFNVPNVHQIWQILNKNERSRRPTSCIDRMATPLGN